MILHCDDGIRHVEVVLEDPMDEKHQFKFRAVGSSTQAFHHSFAVQTSRSACGVRPDATA